MSFVGNLRFPLSHYPISQKSRRLKSPSSWFFSQLPALNKKLGRLTCSRHSDSREQPAEKRTEEKKMKIRERKREEREKMPFPCSYPEFPLCFSLLFFMPLLATLTPGTGCLPYGHTIICSLFLSILIMVKLYKFK